MLWILCKFCGHLLSVRRTFKSPQLANILSVALMHIISPTEIPPPSLIYEQNSLHLLCSFQFFGVVSYLVHF